MTHQPLTKAERDVIASTYDDENTFRLLADLDAAEAERDEAVALIDAAKSDVRPESFLEHAQAILAKCIAPYSCEQMKAVGDALAGCYRKWELMSEFAMKAGEERDAAQAALKCKGCGGTVGDHLAPDQGGCPGSFEIDGVQMVPLSGRNDAVAQRDRAEAERDELRAALIASGNAVGAALTDRCSSQFLCNVPAEVTLVYKRIAAQRDRAEAERDDYRERLADARQKLIAMEEQAMVDEDGMSMRPFDERLRKVEAERDALKAQRDNLHARLYPQPCKGCPGCSSYADCPDEIDRLTTERDALKAKLADPRRVLIHETEVVATKEEIAKLKKELADLSEADEELHACRALVNATSENLSVDLERMVDDLAEANEKAARSEKDAHSWCELYTDTKAKLAALLQAATDLREVAFDGPSEPKGAGVHGGREGLFDWKQRINRESAAAIAAAKVTT